MPSEMTGESAIERQFSEHRALMIDVDACRPAEADEYLAPARAELRALQDAALCVRLAICEDWALISLDYWEAEDDSGWRLTRWIGGEQESVDTGPTIDGIPQLTDAARTAISQALGRKAGS